jgi:hypothetical protein
MRIRSKPYFTINRLLLFQLQLAISEKQIIDFFYLFIQPK